MVINGIDCNTGCSSGVAACIAGQPFDENSADFAQPGAPGGMMGSMGCGSIIPERSKSGGGIRKNFPAWFDSSQYRPVYDTLIEKQDREIKDWRLSI